MGRACPGGAKVGPSEKATESLGSFPCAGLYAGSTFARENGRMAHGVNFDEKPDPAVSRAFGTYDWPTSWPISVEVATPRGEKKANPLRDVSKVGREPFQSTSIAGFKALDHALAD